MRVAFPIHRKNYYRPLGPVIEEALRRGHQVDCWHDWSQSRRGPKGSEFPDAVPIALSRGSKVRTFRGTADLIRQIEIDEPDVVLSLDPPPHAAGQRIAPKWLWLQYAADILVYSTREGVLAADSVATYSPYWATKLTERFAGPGTTREFERRTVAVGMPELDILSQIDPDEVRRRLGLAPGSILEWDAEGEVIVVRRGHRYSSADVHSTLFPEGPPPPRSLAEMEDGIRRQVKKRRARR